MTSAAQELADFQSLVGQELPGGQALEPIERGDIRRWVYFGVEDYNRRWNDVEVARELGEEDLAAPPSFFYGLDYTTSQMLVGRVEGALPIYGGAKWTFHRPCRVGDSVEVERKLESVQERVGRFSGPMIETVARTSFRLAGTDTTLAECESRIFRCRIQKAAVGGKYDEQPQADPERLRELQSIQDGYVSRAHEKVDLSAVQVGETLPSLVKGPHTSRSLLRHRYGFRTYPGWSWDQTLRNSGDQDASFFRALGYPPEFADMPSKWHEDPEFGAKMGFPRGGDFGPQRVSWMIQLVTDWMGVDGTLDEIEVRLLRPNPIGDISHVTGEVIERTEEADRISFAVDLRMTDQIEREQAVGKARLHIKR